MTVRSDAAALQERKVAAVLELDLDRCLNVYGASPCKAGRRFAPTLDFDFTGTAPSLVPTIGVAALAVTRAGATATRVNAAGLLEVVAANTPRFDFDPVTLTCKGLLIEEPRTQLVTKTDFSSGWSGVLGVVVPGPMGADARRETWIATAFPQKSQTIAVVNGTRYTLSVRMKHDVPGTLIGLVSNAGNLALNVSVVATGGWDEIVATAVATGTGNANFLMVFNNSGAVTTSGCSYSMPQMEVGAFKTSFIPNLTAGAVTRNSDLPLTPTGAWFSGAEGAMFTEADASIFAGVNNAIVAYFHDGTANNTIGVRLDNNGVPGLRVVTGGVVQAFLSSGAGYTSGAIALMASAYKVNDFAQSYNGGAVGTDVLGTIPVVNQLYLGSDGGQYLNGHLRRFAYYNTRQVNANLVTLAGSGLIDFSGASYNTFGTCQDPADYLRGTITRRFSSRGFVLPVTENQARPYIDEVTIAPAEIDPASGFAVRSATTIAFKDEACPDTVDDDPYVAFRTVAAGGTYWRRLLARNKNSAGRYARLRRGFVLSPFDWAAFQTELYIAQSLTGPANDARFTITLSDPVQWLEKVQIPAPTDGQLAAALAATLDAGFAQAGAAGSITLQAAASQVDGTYVGAEVLILAGKGAGQRRVINGYTGVTRVATVSVAWTTAPDGTSSYEVAPLNLTLAAGNGAQYADPVATGLPQYVKIGDEVIRYTAIAGDVLSWTDGTYRAQFGTVRAQASVSAAVQQAKVWSAASVTSLITEIITLGKVPLALIDAAGLAAEDVNWYGTAAAITVCITKPTKASDLLKDLLIDLNMLVWWDPVAQLVKFKANMPELAAPATLTDDNLILGQTAPEVLDAERLTRMAIYYGPRTATLNLTEAKSFGFAALRIDTTAESANEYGDVRADSRYSRWLGPQNALFAQATLARRLGFRRDAPISLAFRLDPKDDVSLGEIRDISSRALVDANGNPKTVRVRVTKRADQLTHLEVVARATNLGQRFAFIAPAAYPDYGAATDLQRAYAFIANAQGFMTDGSAAYVVA